ncbi:MAG: zinc ABC transporter substrate-binding protein [Thermoleophilia bacterium]|nr:zinc ABC transporter substrate-binding protein [Thermoleophilia bacterium]MDH4338751.1 zinc ABC transporter substrate-binding protein [Thermoleophilia bacterium]MDH5282205.1 zinc ABC transporter substrate-binding protein [Thermoleophilia bacterium]
MSAVRVLALLTLTACLAGCGGKEDADSRRVVVTGFYPLAWAAERIGGADFRVVNLTPAGAEPHDLELSPRDVAAIRDAHFVVYVGGGFQPALEEAVAARDDASLDVLAAGADPHVWLDAKRFADIALSVGAALGRPAPASRLADELEALDERYRVGLAKCERRTFVTSHAAFATLAKRYGLKELPLAGRSPEAEPSPKKLERLIGDVRDSGATTVFSEPLISKRLVETVARETGATVDVLDPAEGLSQERLAAGEDYFSVMRSNLTGLRRALECR